MKATYIIAEAGVNHNGDVDTASALVKAAADIGADAVKFQTFKAEKIVTETALKADYQKTEDDSQRDMLASLELSEEDHKSLQRFCVDCGIEFLSSSFHLEANSFLQENLGLKRIKFGSGELTNAPLLWDAARRQMQIIFSTGMASLAEIKIALNFLAQGYDQPDQNPVVDKSDAFLKSAKVKENVVVLHCTSAYPAQFEDLHLNCIKTLQEELGLTIGFSDHSSGIEASLAAVALGAGVIEKHLTLDQAMPGPDHAASLVPEEFGALVRGIRNIEKAKGSFEKKCRAVEENVALVARKTIVAADKISAGDIFTPENITLKRTGLQGGISGFLYWDILGQKASQNFAKEDLIKL